MLFFSGIQTACVVFSPMGLESRGHNPGGKRTEKRYQHQSKKKEEAREGRTKTRTGLERGGGTANRRGKVCLLVSFTVQEGSPGPEKLEAAGSRTRLLPEQAHYLLIY